MEYVGAWHAQRPIQTRDDISALEGAGIAPTRHDHRHGAHLRLCRQGAAGQPAASAGREDLEQVAVQKWERGLRHGVAEATAEGQHPGPSGHEDELEMQAPHKGPVFPAEAVEHGSHDLTLDASQAVRVDQQGRREGAHAVRPGAAVLVQRPLVVLDGKGQHSVVETVRHCDHGNLRASRPLREPRLVVRGVCQRHPMALRKGPREAKPGGGVDLSRGLRGPEDGHAIGPEHVGKALREELLGADGDEGDVPLPAEVADLLEEWSRQRDVGGDQRGGTAVFCVEGVAGAEDLLADGATVAWRDVDGPDPVRLA